MVLGDLHMQIAEGLSPSAMQAIVMKGRVKMKRTFTRLLCGMITVAMIFSLNVTVFAASDDGEAIPYYVGTQTTHSYDCEIGKPTEKTEGTWKHFYTGDPAQRDGEYDSIQHSVTYGHSITGGVVGSVKEKIQLELSISFSKDETFSITKNSASLKKGEYIKAYWIKNYDEYTVKQIDHQHTFGFEQQENFGPYVKVDRYHDEISYVTVKKALQPKIRVEYWKDGKKVRSAGEETLLDRVEYYEFIDGEYQLVGSELS